VTEPTASPPADATAARSARVVRFASIL
jgi:hypothetical protein